MENRRYALVLTGEVLPGFAQEAVWPALAAYFRMEPERFAAEVVARAPLSIKQDEDLGKLQTLQAGGAAAGAVLEICEPDPRPPLFVLLDHRPRGPLPRAFADARVRSGTWDGSLEVAEAGTDRWRPWRELDFPALIELPPAPPPEPPAEAGPAGPSAQAAAGAPSGPAAEPAAPAMPPPPVAAGPLPPGEAIHAGFWRRCAAYLMDYFLVGLVAALVSALLPWGDGEGAGDLTGMAAEAAQDFLVYGLFAWLYFSLQESSRAQASLGKRAMGLKVVDRCGARIGFGRATLRFFAGALSNLVFGIGYLMAGWTARRQALHDLVAGTLVVFRGVEPGRPLPAARPPMPWYGWAVNVLFVLGLLLCAVGVVAFAPGLGAGALPAGSGF